MTTRPATYRALLPLALLLAIGAGPTTQPTPAAAPTAPTVPTQTVPPQTVPPPTVPPVAAADDPTQFDLYGYLRTTAAKRASDPIGPIAERMGTAAMLLGGMETDAPVQARQKMAMADLDGVIQQLEAQCKSGGSGASPNPTKPLGKSMITGGPGGSGPLHDAQAGTRVWGQLPAKDRDQITQSQTEGFPAGYESVLASYYSRLSQEQVGGDAPPAAGPTTRPD